MVSYKPLQYTVPLLRPSKKGETSRDGGQDGGAAKKYLVEFSHFGNGISRINPPITGVKKPTWKFNSHLFHWYNWGYNPLSKWDKFLNM